MLTTLYFVHRSLQNPVGSTHPVKFDKASQNICSFLVTRELQEESFGAASANAAVFVVQIDLISNLGSTSW